jgi:hypothetical protein
MICKTSEIYSTFSLCRFDVGDIVLQERCPITPTDTALMLKARLAELGAKLLQETLKDLPHCLHKSVPQPDFGITYGMSYSFASHLCTVVFQTNMFTAGYPKNG